MVLADMHHSAGLMLSEEGKECICLLCCMAADCVAASCVEHLCVKLTPFVRKTDNKALFDT